MRAFVVGVACGALSLAVPAQPQRPSAAASAASSAAMARAKRMADGPLRAIIEAGKVRRRFDGDGGVGAEAVEAAARRPPPRRAAAADTSASAPTLGSGPPAASATPVAPVAAPPSTSSEVIVTLPAAAPRASAASAAPLVMRSAMLPPSPALPVVTQVPPLPPPQASPASPDAERPPRAPTTRPNLVMLVEPGIPDHLLRTLTRREVRVELSLRADGTVAGVQLLPPAPEDLAPYLVEALRQWRYDPLPGPRRHRVELVLEVGR